MCDRYAMSGTAYSTAQVRFPCLLLRTARHGVLPQGLDFAWCMSTDSGLPSPDFVFFLDVDPREIAAVRRWAPFPVQCVFYSL